MNTSKPSTHTPTTTKTTETAKNPEPTKTTAPVKEPIATTTKNPEPTATPEPSVAASAKKRAKTEDIGKRTLTVTLEPRLYKQVRLLASVEGVTITKIFVDSVSRSVPARLKIALVSIQEDE